MPQSREGEECVATLFLDSDRTARNPFCWASKNAMQSLKKLSDTLAPFAPDEGHNCALWSRAIHLRKLGVPFHDAAGWLNRWILENAHRFTRAIPSTEIERQLRNAYNEQPSARTGGGAKTQTKRVKVNASRDAFDWVTQEVLSDYSLAEMRQEGRAAVFADFAPGDFVRRLFAAGELVCFGRQIYEMTTQRVDDCADALNSAQTQFIVPNPMAALRGQTKEGKESVRCEGNACSENGRRFFVVELDTPFGDVVPKDEQARVLRFLSTFDGMRLEVVVNSGGKSLQGWFRVLSANAKDAFWRCALSLGADKAGAILCQAFRMPHGTRTKEGASTRQAVEYVSPIFFSL